MAGNSSSAVADRTEVGSYFVANYPPFSVWTEAAVAGEAGAGPAAPPPPRGAARRRPPVVPFHDPARRTRAAPDCGQSLDHRRGDYLRVRTRDADRGQAVGHPRHGR